MKYLIANWKIKLSVSKELELSRSLAALPFKGDASIIGIAPSFLTICEIAKIIKNAPILVGAQDCFWEDAGAYTGGISPRELERAGCKFVIVGHSERRMYFQESDEIINKKIRAVIANEMIPILCVGESRHHRQSGNKDHIVRRQIELGLEGIHLVGSHKLFIAYEPIWAIGTGIPADVQTIEYMHRVIHQSLIDIFPRGIVENNTAILYGGSVDETNIEQFLENQDIDGALIGSASTDFSKFSAIIERTNIVK